MASRIIIEIVAFLSIYWGLFGTICYLLREREVFGKTLRDYLFPVWFFLIIAAGGVAFQYIGMTIGVKSPGTIGQFLWSAGLLISVPYLIWKNDFEIQNVFIFAILFDLIIHGVKISVRYVIYGAYDPVYRSITYIRSRFLYGSALVLFSSTFIAFAIYLILELQKDHKSSRNILLNVTGSIATILLLLVSIMLYQPGFSLSLSSRLRIIIVIVVAAGIIGELLERKLTK